jgi:hypothetical protein
VHRVTQVVQQLANDLTLVFLLNPAKDGGVGRGRGDSEAGFQGPFLRSGVAAELTPRLGSSPRSLKKLPAAGKRDPAPR